ncbi:MAG: phosphate--acyl-ACP acyltransferase, partial [Endomicrobium sp.]|nr:phosphate--acyl-ACP acyltransferase [Endomicrobium sp.]
EVLLKLIRVSLKRHPITWASLPFLWFAIKDLRKKVDYNEVGGAPLLGVDGVCIVGHGASNCRAVKNAIFTGAKAAEHNLIKDIREAIAKSKID